MSHVTHMNESCHSATNPSAPIPSRCAWTSHAMTFMSHEWVTSHIWMSHITQMNESYSVYFTQMNESCRNSTASFAPIPSVCAWIRHVMKGLSRGWVISHACISHITHMNESGRIFTASSASIIPACAHEGVTSWVMSRHVTWMSHITQINESYYTYEWVMS